MLPPSQPFPQLGEGFYALKFRNEQTGDRGDKESISARVLKSGGTILW